MGRITAAALQSILVHKEGGRVERPGEGRMRSSFPPPGDGNAPGDASDLPLAGGRVLKAIGTGSFSSLVDASVAEVLEQHFEDLAKERAALVGEEIRQRLLDRIQEQARSVRGVSPATFLQELEQSREQMIRSRDRARDELEELRRQSERMRADAVSAAPGPTLFDAEGGCGLRESLTALGVELLEGRVTHEDFQVRMLELVGEVARGERKHAIEDRRSERAAEVGVFERRIAKLNQSLSEAEAAIGDIERLRDREGWSSGHRGVQGLDRRDRLVTKKRLLLHAVYRQNCGLQQRG